MVNIIFESHATTLDNETKTASGWYDVELSELGRTQAKELGERYRDNGKKIDMIFCSDLQRSFTTAALAFGATVPTLKDDRLRECNYGELTRVPMKEIEGMKANCISSPFPDGESFEDTSRRMKAFLQDLLSQYDGKTVMIIGHRATQYGLEEHTKGLALRDVVTAPWKWQPGWLYSLTTL